jgi:hypothetical protein
MDTPGKLPALLAEADFHQAQVQTVPWSHRPDLEEFVARHTLLGVTGRRLAGLEPATRAEFLRHVRSRLEHLGAEDLVDRSEVLAATAVAR